MNMQRIVNFGLLLAILAIGVSAKPLPSNEDLIADMLVLVNSTKLERHMDTRSAEGSGDGDMIPIQHLSSSVMERMQQAPPHEAEARESMEATSNDAESLAETLQDEGSGVGGIGFEAKGMLEEVEVKDPEEDTSALDEKADMKNEEERVSVIENEPKGKTEAKEGSGENLEDNELVENNISIETVSNIENLKNETVQEIYSSDLKAEPIISKTSNIVVELPKEPEEKTVIDSGETEQEKETDEEENVDKKASDEEVSKIEAVDILTEAPLGADYKDKSSEIEIKEEVVNPESAPTAAAAITDTVVGMPETHENVEISVESTLGLTTESTEKEGRIETAVNDTHIAPDVSFTVAPVERADDDEISPTPPHVESSSEVSPPIIEEETSIEEIKKEHETSPSIVEEKTSTEEIVKEGETDPPIIEEETVIEEMKKEDEKSPPILEEETSTEEIMKENETSPPIIEEEPSTEEVKKENETSLFIKGETSSEEVKKENETSPLFIKEETFSEEVKKEEETTIPSSIMPVVSSSTESFSSPSPVPKSIAEVNDDEIVAIESSTEISTTSETNVDLVGIIEGTFVQKASLQVPQDKKEVANDSSVVQEASIYKSISMYVIAGILAIIFIAFVIMFTVRYRGRRRRMRPENGSEKDTDNPLLSNGKYQEDSDDNNIKNNEITPLVIKNTSQINKFEKSPNFSSQKNINTVVNEKNIEKDNVLKSNQTIIEDEDDAKKCVQDDLDEEKKKLADVKEPPGAEKVVVRTRVDEDSIPRKPVIVSRNGHNYQSVPGVDTET